MTYFAQTILMEELMALLIFTNDIGHLITVVSVRKTNTAFKVVDDTVRSLAQCRMLLCLEKW